MRSRHTSPQPRHCRAETPHTVPSPDPNPASLRHQTLGPVLTSERCLLRLRPVGTSRDMQIFKQTHVGARGSSDGHLPDQDPGTAVDGTSLVPRCSEHRQPALGGAPHARQPRPGGRAEEGHL